MAPLADIGVTDSLILWNIVETHFDELEFAVEQFERRLEDPMRTLDDLAKYPQPWLDAHVDGLVVGGDEVRMKILAPQLAEAAADQASRVQAAALAVIAAGRFDLLWPAVSSDHDVVRRAVARAAALQPRPQLDAWVHDRLNQKPSESALAGLLELTAARREAPPNLLAALQSEDAGLVAAATRAALHGDSKLYLPVLEHLLNHPDRGVRDAALIATLVWQSRAAWQALERDALTSSDAMTLALYAALGGRKHHARLVERLASETDRAPVLFALGYSGNAAMLAELVKFLRSPVSLERKVAVQSISLISGLELTSQEYVITTGAAQEPGQLPPPEADPEARAALPPLDEEDLDADLVPQPEDGLPDFDARLIERYCKRLTLDSSRRLLGGAPFGAEMLLDYLERSALRRHHALALALGVLTAGSVWFESRASAAGQRAQLAALRARGIGSVLRAYKDW
jgi:uncharacterized protein (TIGR02270 family)